MKHFSKIILGTLLLSGLAFAVIGCVSSGSVEVSDGYYYGPGYRDPWFRGGAWFDGDRGYDRRGHDEPRRTGGHDAYISPPRMPSAPRPPSGPHLPSPPRRPH